LEENEEDADDDIESVLAAEEDEAASKQELEKAEIGGESSQGTEDLLDALKSAAI
jgi:hypothetical protein